MSCTRLVADYIREKGLPETLPTTLQARKDFLLQSRWDCVGQGCDPQTNASRQKQLKQNKLVETGFLAWVNRRSLGCINRIRGLTVGLDEKTGFIGTGNTTSACEGICSNVSLTADECFACAKSHLDQCVDETQQRIVWQDYFLKEGAECLTCFGQHTEGLQDTSEKSWGCITGDLVATADRVTPMSTTTLTIIIVACVIIAIFLIVGIVLLVRKVQKVVPNQNEPNASSLSDA